MKALQFEYASWSGTTALRSVEPIRVYFGSTDYHPESQWLMEGWDTDKEAIRTFAMRDIAGIREIET